MVETTLLILFLTFLSKSAANDDREERLLLSDSDYVDQRVGHLESLVIQLQSRISNLENQQQHGTSGGSVYIRWGRKSCPHPLSSQIYTGYAGGGYYNHAGSGSNYVCMPSDPIYGNRSKSLATTYGYIYGGEYETNFFGAKSQDEDVPCAVCGTSNAKLLMIPGRNACYPGWTAQYHGYLASSHYGHPAQHDYVCVDSTAEFLNGGQRNTEGALFYPVISECGALECPPYVNSEPLTCVVCTQ